MFDDLVLIDISHVSPILVAAVLVVLAAALTWLILRRLPVR